MFLAQGTQPEKLEKKIKISSHQLPNNKTPRFSGNEAFLL